MLIIFLIVAALLVGLLVILAINPLLWLEYERRWTGVDRSQLITNRGRFAAMTRLAAVVAIVLLVFFVLGVINFESVFETQGTANRALIEKEMERDRALRQQFPNRIRTVPPPLMPEQPRP